MDRLKSKVNSSTEHSVDAGDISVTRDTNEWVKVPDVQVVVVPDGSPGAGSEAVNEGPKNEIPPQLNHPPDPTTTQTSAERRTSPRNSSTSHPKT